MILLNSICARNFYSYKSLEFYFLEPSLYLIRGEIDGNPRKSNGAGKSTIAEAITWALFGQTIRDGLSDDVINNVEGGGCFSKIEFEVGGTNYQVERYRKHKKRGNALLLFRDGEGIGADLIPETQRKIEQIIGMDYPLFISTHIFGLSSIAFLKATDVDRKRIIDGIIKSDFSLEREALSKKIGSLDSRMSLLLDREGKFTSRIDHAEGSISVLEDGIRKYSKEIDAVKFKRNNSMPDHKTGIGMADFSSVWSLVFPEKKIVVSPLAEGIILREVKKISGDKERLASDISKAKTEEDSLRDRIANAKGKICSYCGSTLKAGSGKKSISKMVDESERLSAEIKVDKAKASALEVRLDSVYALLTEYRNYCREALEREQNQKEFDNKIFMLEEAVKSEGAMAEEVRLNIKKFILRIKIIQSKKQKANVGLRYYRMLDKLFRPSGAMKSFMVSKILPLIEESANKILLTMANDMSVRVRMGDKGKIIASCYKTGAANKYALASEGEKSKVNLAVGYSLRKFFPNKFNFVFFDDVFGSIDSDGIESDVKSLSNLREEGEFIFCISPRDIDSSYFHNTIEVCKENGISFIKS